MEKLTKALMTDETGQAIVTKLTALSGQMHELAMATRGSAILFESESDISVLGDGGYLAVYVGSTNPLVISGWTGDNSLVTGHLYYLIKSGTAVASSDLGEYGGAVTDTTLSISGAPADAKAVGEALAEKADADDVGDLSQLTTTAKEDLVSAINEANEAVTGINGRLEQQGEDITELQNGGYIADQQQIESKINAWLDDHPEATTTVQDRSLTEAKFSDALALKTVKDYVTPEMFGAVGDGSTDDHVAVQAALDSGKTVIAFNNYRTSVPLIISGEKRIIHFYGRLSSTVSNVVVIENAQNCDLFFNELHTTSGNALTFRASGLTYNQYNRVKFNRLRAENKCISFETSDARWCNENTIVGGRCAYGDWAIYADDSSNISVSYSCIEGNSFEHIGTEGTTHGIYFGRVDNTTIIAPRYAEASHFLTTVGACRNLTIINKTNVNPIKYILSTDTYGVIIGGQLTGGSVDYATSANIVNIYRGKLYSICHDRYLNVIGITDSDGVADLTSFEYAECPTYINAPITTKELKLPSYYGVTRGINRFILGANETTNREITVKVDDTVIAVFGNEIPNYSFIQMEWDIQLGWHYIITKRTRMS